MQRSRRSGRRRTAVGLRTTQNLKPALINHLALDGSAGFEPVSHSSLNYRFFVSLNFELSAPATRPPEEAALADAGAGSTRRPLT